MTYTAVIRQRGQLTIPDQVRHMAAWLQAGAVVGVEVAEEEVRIRPYAEARKRIDWNEVWRKIELARSFKGKRGNLSAMIAEDRDSH